jgi:hypothetical protein
MIEENINTKDALTIIKNYRKQYWILDTFVMFTSVIDKLKRLFKSIDSEISEQEINLEVINYQVHLQTKREKIYSDLINELNLKLVEKITNPITTPKHENIFCNNGFILFEHILKEYVKTNRGRLTDIHFFYWSMYNNNPQLIHQRPERFKEWFFENYNEDLGKIKNYEDIKNKDRLIHYSNALDWFKPQNQQRTAKVQFRTSHITNDLEPFGLSNNLKQIRYVNSTIYFDKSSGTTTTN